jgi:hypothetical protein
MSDNVTMFPGETTRKRPPDQILDEAQRAGLETVVVIGRDANGGLWALSSDPDLAQVNLLIDHAKTCYISRLGPAF